MKYILNNFFIFLLIFLKLDIVFISYSAHENLKKSFNEKTDMNEIIVDYSNALSGDSYSNSLNSKKNDFLEKFENCFHLSEKGFSKEKQKFAMYAFSNLIGGIGYIFY